MQQQQQQQQQGVPQQQQQSGLHQLLQQLQQLHKSAAASAAKPARQQMPPKDALSDDYPIVKHNLAWNAAAFEAAAAAAAGSLHGVQQFPSQLSADSSRSCAAQQPLQQQQHSKGNYRHSKPLRQALRLGVLMLVHEKGAAAAEVWDAWERSQGGKAVVCVHPKAGVSSKGLPAAAWVSSRQLPSQIPSKWGCISLTVAILQAAAEMLQQQPQLQHIAVVSGQDIPVAAVSRDLRPGLSLFGRFQFGKQFDAAAGRVAAEVLQQQLGMCEHESKAWGDALVFHHTWMVLDRQLLLALISKQEELLRVGTVLNQRFMQPDMAVAADEFILITAAIRYGFVKQVVQRKLHTHMAAVRRQQHKQQQALSAVQQAFSSVRAVHRMSSKARPAKRQRLALAAKCQAGQEGAQQAGKASSSSSGSSDGSNGSSLTRSRRLFRQSAQSTPTAVARTSDDSSSVSLNGSRDASSPRNSSSNGSSVGSICVQPQVESPNIYGPLVTMDSVTAMREGTYGVLLDCCPTLALFHPTETRHPHTWRNFADRLLVDVNSDTASDHELSLLEALGLVRTNAALFFRKVDRLQGQEPAQLQKCLQRLWQSKPLPAMLA